MKLKFRNNFNIYSRAKLTLLTLGRGLSTGQRASAMTRTHCRCNMYVPKIMANASLNHWYPSSSYSSFRSGGDRNNNYEHNHFVVHPCRPHRHRPAAINSEQTLQSRQHCQNSRMGKTRGGEDVIFTRMFGFYG